VSLIIPKPENNANPLLAFVHYLSIYLLGMLMSHYKDQFFKLLANKLVLAGIFVSVLCLSYFIFFGFTHLWFIQKVLLSVFLIYLLYRFEHVKSKFLERTFSSLDYLGSISFGLFFLHGYILGALKMVFNKLSWEFSGVYWSVLLLIVIAFTIFFSTLAIIATQRVFGKKSRKLIGC
jgi:hypothetical protein